MLVLYDVGKCKFRRSRTVEQVKHFNFGTNKSKKWLMLAKKSQEVLSVMDNYRSHKISSLYKILTWNLPFYSYTNFYHCMLLND